MVATTLTKKSILDQFQLFQGGTGGLDSWLGLKTPDVMLDALADIENHPLSRARFNQLLTLAHEAPISQPLFAYYWLDAPDHPYDVRSVPGYDERWPGSRNISSIDQLYWGLYRFYMDALLYFGSIRTAYQRLRQLSKRDLRSFFASSRFSGFDDRGEALMLSQIAKDNRYLISEMACKSFDTAGKTSDANQLQQVLLDLYHKHRAGGGGPVTALQLLTGEYAKAKYGHLDRQLRLSADDFLEELFEDEDSLREKIRRVALDFARARNVALYNTSMYLSMVGDLDVYIATSMRYRYDFRDMANFCETVFSDDKLQGLKPAIFRPHT